MAKTGAAGRPSTLLGVLVVGVVMGWLGRSMVPGGGIPPTAAPPCHTAALPSAPIPTLLLHAEQPPPPVLRAAQPPPPVLHAEELPAPWGQLGACTIQPVVSRGDDEQHCPQCAAMMCTEQCRYDTSWCGVARAFACTAERLPADSVAFFPSIGRDPFPVPRCHYMAAQEDPYTGWDSHTFNSGLYIMGRVLRSETYALVRTHATLVEQRLPSAASQCTAHLVYDPDDRSAKALTPMLMVGDENEFLAKLAINLRPATYVEWGSGGTTNWITPLAHRSYSIEHDQQYCDAGAASPVQRCLKDAGRLTSVCARRDAESYVRSVDTFQERTFDLVLIDGKVRLACALYVMRYLTDDSVVLIHDLMPRIKSAEAAGRFGQLDVVFKYYDLIGHTRTIAAFRRKPGAQPPSDDEWRGHTSHFFRSQY